MQPLRKEKRDGHKLHPTKKRAWKNTSMHVSGQMGFPAGRGWTQPKLDTAEAGHSRSRTQPGLDAAGAYAGRGPCAKPGPPAGQLCWPWAG